MPGPSVTLPPNPWDFGTSTGTLTVSVTPVNSCARSGDAVLSESAWPGRYAAMCSRGLTSLQVPTIMVSSCRRGSSHGRIEASWEMGGRSSPVSGDLRSGRVVARRNGFSTQTGRGVLRPGGLFGFCPRLGMVLSDQRASPDDCCDAPWHTSPAGVLEASASAALVHRSRPGGQGQPRWRCSLQARCSSPARQRFSWIAPA